MDIESDAKIQADIIWSDWTQKFQLKPRMTWLELYQLTRYFLEECRKREIDPQTIDLRHEIDPQISYRESKEQIHDLLRVKPSPEEALEEELARLTLETKYRIIEETELDKLKAIEEKVTRLTQQIKREKAEKQAAVAEREETLKRLEEEISRKPALKIEVLTNFREGIQVFHKGEVLETHNVDWGLQKIEQGLARRVTAEEEVKPIVEKPKVAPPPPLESVRERATHLKRLYRAILERNSVPTGYFYDNFLLELEQVIMGLPHDEQEKHVENFAMDAVNNYQAKRAVAIRERISVPTPAWKEAVERQIDNWKKVEGGYLTPEGKFIPEESMEEEWRQRTQVKPPAPPEIPLYTWLLANYGSLLGISERYRPEFVEGMPRELRSKVWSAFYKLSIDEQKQLIAQYRSHFPMVKSQSMKEWLEERGVNWDDYAQMSNEDKADLVDEYCRVRG